MIKPVINIPKKRIVKAGLRLLWIHRINPKFMKVNLEVINGYFNSIPVADITMPTIAIKVTKDR